MVARHMPVAIRPAQVAAITSRPCMSLCAKRTMGMEARRRPARKDMPVMVFRNRSPTGCGVPPDRQRQQLSSVRRATTMLPA